jgi:hypothetical protein
MLCRAARFFTTQKIFAHREIWEGMEHGRKKTGAWAPVFSPTRRQRKAAGSAQLITSSFHQPDAAAASKQANRYWP